MDTKQKDPKQEKSRYRYQSEIQQMMFVFGEVADPLPETTMLVEDIVRSQVIEIIIQAAAQAQKRGSRYMNAEDLIFLIRHDRAKVNRLRSFLSWKDVRKNAKESSGDPVEEMLEETSADKPGKTRRRIVKLSWELINQFSDPLGPLNAAGALGTGLALGGGVDSDAEEDEEELEAYADSVQRLRDADEITRAMTREEYVHYSECRQASFTYRKAKRFREWANMASYIDMKPNDDIIDILGFLTFEIVSTLTEGAMRVKLDLIREKKGGGEQTAGGGGVAGGPGSGVTQGEGGEAGKKRKRAKEDIGGDGEEGGESDEEGAAGGKGWVGEDESVANLNDKHRDLNQDGKISRKI
ncbi:TFIID domain-containing protein [Endogone sp. FLAS-F59071]|nr:TFIID domain-containing protein [Endogone sp. FLAS-F59071]|eukprot:RUS21011.1 TFIID domain-containing protein [Endogone sp. FLAS-F59071]